MNFFFKIIDFSKAYLKRTLQKIDIFITRKKVGRTPEINNSKIKKKFDKLNLLVSSQSNEKYTFVCYRGMQHVIMAPKSFLYSHAIFPTLLLIPTIVALFSTSMPSCLGGLLFFSFFFTRSHAVSGSLFLSRK